MKIQKLNFGAGDDYMEGYINIDIRDNVKTDVKWDCNKFPYPFKDNTFSEVIMYAVLEHLEKPLDVLREIHRICKNGALIRLRNADKSNFSAFGDLEHHYYITELTFREDLMRQYELDKMFKVKRFWYEYTNKYKKYIPFKKILRIYLNGIYDRICWELEVVK